MIHSPDLSAPDGLVPVSFPANLTEHRNFVSGEPDGDRLRVRYYFDEVGGRLVARAWFGPGAEGPPGHAHGGSLAAVLDEAMGMAAWLAGHPVLAARLAVDFRRALPLLTVASVEARVEHVEGSKVHVAARLTRADGTLVAESTGLFVNVGLERLGEMGGA